ncbi:MAG TPA: hypothetical protein VGM42_17850 [Rhodopila sp.]
MKRQEDAGIDIVTDGEQSPIADAMAYVQPERLLPCTNCGMAPRSVDVAASKLVALGQGATLARQRLGV